MINDIKEKALIEKVPIIKDGGLSFLLETIKKTNAKDILELGTAVGYSSINMAKLDKDIHIDTIEKNIDMYNQAIRNIKELNLDNQINVSLLPIEEYKTDKKYDLIFVDAAKAQYPKYLEQFLPNLKDDGLFFFDNMVFHNLIYDVDSIESRNRRSLVKKIIKFRETITNDNRFDIIFYDSIGDGILIVRRKKNGL